MRWPWRRRRDADDAAAQAARDAGRVLAEEQRRMDEAAELARSLEQLRRRDSFAEAMRIALGGRP